MAIQSLTVRHDAIMDYLMANPHVKLGDVATHFGMTQAWLSQVIHSEIFQDRLREKQDIAFHHTILPLRQKITNIAHQALDKLSDQLEKEQDITAVQRAASDALDRLGYSAKPIQGPGSVTNNIQHNTFVLKSELEEARQLLSRAQPSTALEVIIDGERSPIRLQPAGSARMGETIEGAVVRQPPGLSPNAATEAGDSL